MDENYQFIAEDLGPPVAATAFDAEELAYMKDRLPPRLVEFLTETGHATFAKGGVTLCPPKRFAPILALVFKADADLDHRDCTLVSYSAFGELSVWSARHGIVTIDLPQGEVSSQSLAPAEFPGGFVPPPPPGKPDPNVIACGTIRYEPDEMDYRDFKGDLMLAPCIKAHGVLALGECYGFFPALGLVGPESPTRRVENVKRVQALEHFSFLAQLQSSYLSRLTGSGIENLREIG